MKPERTSPHIIEDRIAMPPWVGERVKSFMLDKRTGNVVLNIRDGVILKAVIEEHLKGT
jgi:hypothetical protein